MRGSSERAVPSSRVLCGPKVWRRFVNKYLVSANRNKTKQNNSAHHRENGRERQQAGLNAHVFFHFLHFR